MLGRHAQPASDGCIATLGRYELIGRLAVGGMAEIYLARDAGPGGAGRKVVVKRVLPHVSNDPAVRAMFLQEARLCMLLQHPNLCRVFDFGDADGCLFLAMEWIDGIPLQRVAHRARGAGGLPPSIAARLIAQVADGLHYAHAACDQDGSALGIVHRDVTPENILLSFSGEVKLLDFGIAKAAIQLHQTQDGALKGKIAYMSPEQFRGDPVDPRSDIFSLGVCLYEAVISRSLYRRSSHYATVAAIVLDEGIPSLCAQRNDIPFELDRIFRRAIARKPEDRYETAAHMRDDLLAFLETRRRPVQRQDIAKVVRRMFPEERRQGPKIDRGALVNLGAMSWSSDVSTSSVAPRHESLDYDIRHMEDSFIQPPRRKHRLVATLSLVCIVLAVAVSVAVLYDSPPHPEPVPELLR